LKYDNIYVNISFFSFSPFTTFFADVYPFVDNLYQSTIFLANYPLYKNKNGWPFYKSLMCREFWCVFRTSLLHSVITQLYAVCRKKNSWESHLKKTMRRFRKSWNSTIQNQYLSTCCQHDSFDIWNVEKYSFQGGKYYLSKIDF